MKNKVSSGPQTRQQPLQLTSVILLIVGGISLFLAQSATWISNSIFNQQTFTSTATGVLQSEQSRSNLSTVIVDRSLANKPIINRLVGNNLKTLVTGLLGTDLASDAVTQITSKSYSYLTTANRQDIAVDLTALKRPLTAIVSTLEQNGRPVQLDPTQIPDSITIIDSSTFPDLSGYVRAALVANMLAWPIAIAALSVYVYLNRKRSVARALYMVCLVVAVVAVVGLMTGPFIPPIIATYINTVPIRTVVTDLVTAFLHPFYSQLTTMLIAAGAVALGVLLRRPFTHMVSRVVQRIAAVKAS